MDITFLNNLFQPYY